MSHKPIAEVRILRMPHLHPKAVRVEIDCRFSTTGLTSIPAPGGPELTRPQMVTGATYEHEQRCGQCDTSQAHQQGDTTLRDATDAIWDRIQQRRRTAYAQERRN